MSSEETLRNNEARALNNNQVISSVSGKKLKSSKKIKSIGAAGFLTATIAVFAVLFSSGNLIPSAISERLIEETDVQYADAVESKKLVFQQALKNGELPQTTVDLLKNDNVVVGYFKDGEFIESNKNNNGELVLIINDKTITADNFIREVSSDLSLYNAFNNSTYSRAAYYYDESAKKVFQRIGTNRNNYTSESDFDTVMDSKVGEGSSVDINNVALVEKTKKNETTGEDEVYYEYETYGEDAKSNNTLSFITGVVEKSLAETSQEATIDAANSLNTADTIAKEQKSSLFFLTFMENISKMKAGDGNDSKINEAMNFLYQKDNSEVVDVKTGEVKTVSGTPLESPSLYSILADEKINPSSVENYSSERILKTIENKTNSTSRESIKNTVASTESRLRGSIGRFISSGVAKASYETINTVEPIVSSSLVNNSYKTYKGIKAGEFLVEGAVNVGKELAKASGGTAGDASAVVAYQKLTEKTLAMDHRIDRMNRSPFDPTSKNTFLGSLIYNLAISVQKNASSSLLSGIKVFSSSFKSAMVSFLPSSFADQTDSYLSSFGDCETYDTISVVGSVHCSEIATFDASTLNDPFNDTGFINFINNNTSLNNGTRSIIENSDLAKFILFNNERITPIGITDGGILDSLSSNSSSILFASDILSMIKRFLGSTEQEKRIASGASFVNSSSNPDWQTYKYAQRYVSLARATASLRQYAGNSSAYNNIAYFEGNENPVIAFLESYYAINH